LINKIIGGQINYCKLRNKVTKINKRKKKEYYKNRIDSVKHDGKKLWHILNEIMSFGIS